MKIEDALSKLNNEQITGALLEFLHSYTSPAFGVLPKSEVDYLVLQLLVKLGVVSAAASAYELATGLRISLTRARTLIYARCLREETESSLDERLRASLCQPIVQKEGDVFVLDIENPLVMDHLRHKVRELGFPSDGSFSPSVARLSLNALSALVESYIPVESREDVRCELVRAGVSDMSMRGVLKSALKVLGQKLASEAGTHVAGRIVDEMLPLLSRKVGDIVIGVKYLLEFASGNERGEMV